MRIFGIAVAIIAAIVILILTFGNGGGDTQPSVEYGPKALTGILLKADVSLTRRGTHLLVINGKPEMYVESKTVNLAALESQTVFIEGELKPNTRTTDPPVLIATSAKSAFTVFAVKGWDIPALGIRVEAPGHWQTTISPSGASFRIGESAQSILVIKSVSGSTLPSGNTFFVQNRRASRVHEGTAQDVYVLDQKRIVHLHFDAAVQQGVNRLEDAVILNQQFDRLLKSMSFLTDPKPTSSSAGSNPFEGHVVCGGPAGLLCPEGYFCTITDASTMEGRCRKR